MLIPHPNSMKTLPEQLKQHGVVSCNVVLVGDAGVGKSALVSRVVFDKFVEVRKLIVIIIRRTLLLLFLFPLG